MAEAFLVQKDKEILGEILRSLPPRPLVSRSQNNGAGKTPDKHSTARDRVQFLQNLFQKEETRMEKALLIQAAAYGLVEMQSDPGRYHYTCPEGCLRLMNYPWFKNFKSGRVCQQCFGRFQTERAVVCRPQIKSVKRTSDTCGFCGHVYRSDADFAVHSIMGKCASARLSCVVVDN